MSYSKVEGTSFLTVNTDASFCGKTKAAGFAYYIRCGNFFAKGGGAFKKLKPSTPHEAELFAIGNAIAICLATDGIGKVSNIVINTDCKSLIYKLKTGSGGENFKMVYNLIKKLQAKTKSSRIMIRHVESHSGIDDKKSHVNEWCDKEAKLHMRKERSLFLT